MGNPEIAGPLARYAAGFAAELAAQGYTGWSISRHLHLMAHLSAWLRGQGMDAGQLSPAVMDRFVPVMRATRCTLVSARALAPMRRYLNGLGVLPQAAAAPGSTRDALLAAYQRYLRGERGVCEKTVKAYTPFAAVFLAGLGDPLEKTLADLTGPAVLDIMTARLRRCRTASARTVVAKASRSLLRYLYAGGWTSRELALVVPPVARWRLAGLPDRLDAAAIAALRDSCDRATETGRRDHAILLLLVRLGLRPCEVAALTFEDLNWRAGEVTIHGKGGRADKLPLPWDVGEAVADYLRTRRSPPSPLRAVFLTAQAPCRALSSHGAGLIVRRAAQRAGIPRCSPRTLRHSLASGLLASGASLADVGEILRHADPATTAIYAKVDRAALAALVRPWPARREARS